MTADIDGDGDLDITSADALPNNSLYWYENNGSETFTKRTISTNADGAKQVYEVDLDNDNEPEIISASENGQLIIYHLNGTPYQNYPISMGSGGFVSSPTVIDVDNDNDFEVIIGTTENLSIFDIKQEGSSEEYYWNNYRGDSHNTGSYVYQSNGTIGDLNSDGIIDVLDLVTTINIIMDLIEPTSTQLFAGDINSDGIIDILDVVQLVNIILS